MSPMAVHSADYPDDDAALIAEFIRLRGEVIAQAARIVELETALAKCTAHGIHLRDVMAERDRTS